MFWAIVLAGGAGSRMGVGRNQIPKVYLPIGVEPVINRPVQRCLDLGRDCEKIVVLTRRSHPRVPEINFEQWAKSWKDLNFAGADADKIDIWFEEDLEADRKGDPAEEGAVVAFDRLRARLATMDADKAPTHLIVVAGDNYIDSKLAPMLATSREHPNSLILAARHIENRFDAQGRFGVIEHDPNSEAGPSWPVISYEEKPNEPCSDAISVGLYCLPVALLTPVSEYLDGIRERARNAVSDEDRKAAWKAAGAPGYYIERLSRRPGALRAFFLPEKDRWVDVGTDSSFLSSLIQLTEDLVLKPQNARDLVVLGETSKLTDKCYFLTSKVTVDGSSRTVTVHIRHNDPIATSASKSWNERTVLSVEAVKEAQSANSGTWIALRDAFREPPSKSQDYNFEKPILISAGMYLLDAAGSAEYAKGRTLVPLFMRDIGARADPLRLTTAAGRVDKLDIIDVCVSELSEEMIFVVAKENGASGILTIAPKKKVVTARRAQLSRIHEKKINLPGIDPQRVAAAVHKHEYNTLTEEAHLAPLHLRNGWKISTEYTDGGSAAPKKWTSEDQVIVIADQVAATLEVRLALLANITANQQHRDVPKWDENLSSLGRLLAIVDGDGYSRTAFMVSVHQLLGFTQTLEQPGDLLVASDPHPNGLQVMAMTDGSTGRLRRPGKKYRLSIAPFTTSVREMCNLLRDLR